MAVPNYLGFAQQPGVLQTAIGTMGTVQQQRAKQEQMGLAQQAGQRAQALAPYQLQTAKQTAEEQPIKFKSDIATAAMNRRLVGAKAQESLEGGDYKGPAGDAHSLLKLKKKYGENSEVYQNGIKEFQAGIQMKKARALAFSSNYWMTRMTTLQKNQFNENFQKENVERQKQGVAPLTLEQYATAAGYKPSTVDNKADMINTHIDETQLNQLKNGKPITPAHHILNHIVQGGDATQLPGAQAPQGEPTTATMGGATTTLAPPPASLQGGVPQAAPGAPPQAPPQAAPGAPPQAPPQAAPGAPPQAPPQADQTGVPKLLTTPDYGKEASQTGLATLKQTSDAQNRSKILYGNQSENTINNMLPDLDAIANYSGPTGSAKLSADRYLFQQTGKPPQQYLAYQRFMANSALLKDQATQYFGKSIMPSAREELDEITTPRNWIDSPAATKEKFNAFIKTLKQEINIRKDALKNPEAYYSDKSGGPKSYSDADYAKTAKETGQTVAQVKADLAKRGRR